MIQRFGHLLFLAAVFFLPWQTAMIFTSAEIGGDPSTYGTFSIYVVEVLIVFAFVLRGRPQFNPAMGAIARAGFFFLAAVFFSLSVSDISVVGWFQVIHVASAAMLFSLLIDTRTNLRQLLSVFLAGLVVPVLFGWYQVLHGSSPDLTLFGISERDAATPGVAVVESGDDRLMRAYGTFPHPNIFGGYIAVGIVALAWLTRFIPKKTQLAGALLTSGVLGATLIVTFSRSAWLGLCLALVLLLGLMLWQGRLPPRRAVPVMALGLASILATLMVFHTPVFTRFDPSQRLEAISIEERASQYATFGEVFFESPFLGVGPAAYTFMLERLDPGHPVWSYQPVHNVFLLILAELGLIGMGVFGYGVFKLNPWANTSLARGGTLFAVAIGMVLFVIGLFDHYLWSLWPGLALSVLSLAALVRWAYSPDQS